MIPGFAGRVTAAGIPVLTVYYWADPAKRPGTPAGAAWETQALAGYPGGKKSPRWRKEMLIEYSAFGGAKLLPDWEEWLALGTIVIPPFAPIGYRFYGSYDHGWRNPSAFHVHGVNGEGEIVTLWECYAAGAPVPHLARVIRGETTRLPDGRVLRGNPYADRVTWAVADPSMWAEDGQGQGGLLNDNPHKHTADLFRQHGVHFQRGERGGDTMVAEWLLGHFWADPRRPRYRITTDCPALIRELGRQRYKELTERLTLTKDVPEELVDKENHAWDGLKMFLKRFPPKASTPTPARTPATFAWWREQAQRAARGQPVRTYRRELIG